LSLDTSGGFIKAYRKLLNWEWYTDIPIKVLFFHCLLKARFSPTRWKGIVLEAGQFPTGLSILAKETGLTVKQIRRALEKLEKTGELGTQRANKGTIITITNYSTYQSKEEMQGTEKTLKGQTKGKQRATIKESKERKEGKEVKDTYLNFVKLTKSEYNKLVEKFGIKGTEDKIFNLNEYGHTKARKFKEYTDHYRVILKWSKNDIDPIRIAERKGKLPL
jgi:DNA-binding transcriptional regulator YhcF (GntR family)